MVPSCIAMRFEVFVEVPARISGGAAHRRVSTLSELHYQRLAQTPTTAIPTNS